VPRKRDKKKWQALYEQLNTEGYDFIEKQIEAKVRSRHALEQEIRNIESMESNPGRKASIKYLKKRLRPKP